MGAASLELYQATLKERYLDASVALQQKLFDEFYDEQAGAFYYNRPDPENIIKQFIDDYDGAEPSANSVISHNLLRLSILTDKVEYEEKLERLFAHFQSRLANSASTLPMMMRTVYEFYLSRPILVTLSKLDSPGSVSTILSKHADKLILLRHSDQDSIVVCREGTCHPPLSSASDLDSFLSRLLHQ